MVFALGRALLALVLFMAFERFVWELLVAELQTKASKLISNAGIGKV